MSKWIISDVHACYHTLTKLIDKVRFIDKEPQFIFVGDYLDRGLHSKAVIDYLLNLQEDGTTVCLRGNHDDVIDWLLNEHSETDMKDHVAGPPTISRVFEWWLWNGLLQTLESYGVPVINRKSTDVILDFRLQVPENHKIFIKNLPMFWECDTHFVCHAFMRPNEELPRSLRFIKRDRYQAHLWSRFPSYPDGSFAPIETKWDKIGVFGHTITLSYQTPTPIKYGNIRLIDTGACQGGYLCAYCCEQDDWVLQATDSRDLKER